MRILIAHTDDGLARSLSRTFRQAGLIVDMADGNNPDDVHDYLRLATPYDLLVHTPALPMHLTARVPARMTTSDTHNDLDEEGEQDPRHILRKAFATVSRTKGHPEEGIVEVDDIRLHLWENKAFFKDQYLPLRPMEYKVLRTLCLHKGQYLSYDTLADHLYSTEDIPAQYKAIIQTLLSGIRNKTKKLGDDAPVIQNRFNVGYKIGDAPEALNSGIKLGATILLESENKLKTSRGTALLGAKEAQILSLLSDGRIHAHAYLLQHLDCHHDTLKVHISNIRQKMAKIGSPDKIETIWGHGYQFREAEPAVSCPLPAPATPS